MTASLAEPVDPGTFAAIMRSLAAGVSIVTTRDADREPRGLTSSAVTSVSADPPLLLVCVDLGSRTLPALRATRRFVVHFMGADGHETCRRFASKADDKFAALRWRDTPSGLPQLLEGVAGWAECELAEEIAAGDHLILLGRVVAGDATPAAPLLYHQRAFGRLAALEDA